MEFPVLLLMIAVNPIQSVIDTAWRSKIDVSEKRSWKGDLMRAPGTRWSILVKQSYIQPLWLSVTVPVATRFLHIVLVFDLEVDNLQMVWTR